MGSLGACIAFVKKTNWIFVCVCNELLSTLFNREVWSFYTPWTFYIRYSYETFLLEVGISTLYNLKHDVYIIILP